MGITPENFTLYRGSFVSTLFAHAGDILTNQGIVPQSKGQETCIVLATRSVHHDKTRPDESIWLQTRIGITGILVMHKKSEKASHKSIFRITREGGFLPNGQRLEEEERERVRTLLSTIGYGLSRNLNPPQSPTVEGKPSLS